MTLAKVNEKTSAVLRFTVTDYYGNPIPVGNIATATMALYDVNTGSIINNVSGVDIRGYINISGVCTLYLSSDDNSLIDQTRATEEHCASFTVVSTGATPTRVQGGYRFLVENAFLIV